MGPLADPEPPVAPRSRRARRGASSSRAPAPRSRSWREALRALVAREPRATVALLARHPEQADVYYEGLRRAEVPDLRRVRAQDFSFRPGVEVTDVRQVKGLEFDYVVMLDVNASQLPGGRRVAPPVPHRGDARGAPAVDHRDLGDRRAR